MATKTTKAPALPFLDSLESNARAGKPSKWLGFVFFAIANRRIPNTHGDIALKYVYLDGVTGYEAAGRFEALRGPDFLTLAKSVEVTPLRSFFGGGYNHTAASVARKELEAIPVATVRNDPELLKRANAARKRSGLPSLASKEEA